MPIVFVVMLLICFAVLYWFLQKQTLYRLFAFLMTSVLTYLSFELTLWSFNLPLPVMMVVGLIPLVCVVYGFRVYDYNRKREREKSKNEHKNKHEEAISL